MDIAAEFTEELGEKIAEVEREWFVYRTGIASTYSWKFDWKIGILHIDIQPIHGYIACLL